MGLLIDTHYHMHSRHRTSIALRSLLANLGAHRRSPLLAGDDLAAVLVACHEDDALEMLWSRRDSVRGEGITLDRDGRRGTLAVTCDGITATLFAGHQFLSTERIEIIGLGEMPRPRKPASLAEILDAIERAGTVPVIPWSPGRWTGNRGRIVKETLAAVGPGRILLGEIALRPMLSPATEVHRAAERFHAPFLYGTDPLPARGDENLGGRFVTRFPEIGAAEFAPSAARDEAAGGRAFQVGSRNGIFEAAFRFARHFAGRALGA